MTRSSRIAFIAGLATLGLIAPVGAYPSGTALDVQIVGTTIRPAAQGSFTIKVLNVEPGTPCFIYFNKKSERVSNDPAGCRTTKPATTMQYSRPTPANVGKLRVIAYQPSQKEDGRSDSTFVYVPGVKATAIAKKGRTQGFSVNFLPEDAEVTFCVFDGSATAATPRGSFACDANDEGEPVATSEVSADTFAVTKDKLTWTPTKAGVQSVRIYANDGGNADVLIWSKSFRVLK